MAGPAVDDAQGMAAGGEVEIDAADVGVFLLKEVDGHQAANRGGSLIHQAAGLAEEHILSILADHGDLRGGDPAVEEQVVQNGADEHLVSGGGRKTGTGQNGRLAVSVEALHLTAQLHKPGGHASDQRSGAVDLAFLGDKDLQIHFAHRIALGLNADHIGAVETDGGLGIQIHRGGQDTAPLVVGVVAADLSAAGGGEVALRCAAKDGSKAGIQGLFPVGS